MTTSTSRRAVLAGIAAVPVVSFDTLSVSSGTPDPVYAAIEAHKIAFKAWAEAVHVEAGLYWQDPRYAAAEHVTAVTSDALEDASMAFAEIQPTTLAGVVALLEYIDAFNHRAFKTPSGDSSHHGWPWLQGEDDPGINAPIVLPFAFEVMNNIRAALASLQA